MACTGALCRRLKMLFCWDRWMIGGRTRRGRRSSGGREVVVRSPPDGGSASLTVSANPFSPVDDETLAVVDCTRRREITETRTFKISRIRKFLHFGSCSGESSLESPAPVKKSSEPEHSPSISRYQSEFAEVELIGSGEFGSVFRCINRLDGCCYAVKRSKPLVRNGYAHRRACNEVHANAALNNHSHVVRYFSAWLEVDRMCIQQEYCNGGDLTGLVARMNRENKSFEESELRILLRHVSEGLRYIHRMKLVHMDIKPDNIFICKNRIWTSQERVTGRKSSDEDNCVEVVNYKIGDLGHVTSSVDTKDLEDEGDCRYLSKEILREDYKDLTKADIFSLGLTIYEAGGGGPLPKNGPAWHDIRNGNIMQIAQYTSKLNDIIKIMIHPDPEKRPSAADLVADEFLFTKKSTEKLQTIE